MDMICKVDADGNVIHANGPYKPSSEIKMHMRVYKLRPDVKSVVHAHPMYATSYAIAGIPLTAPIMPEAVIALGCVPIAPYGTPSTMEIPDSLMPYIQEHDAFMLKNHGALTVGATLTRAFFTMEEVEFNANIMKHAMELGRIEEIPAEKMNSGTTRESEHVTITA